MKNIKITIILMISLFVLAGSCMGCSSRGAVEQGAGYTAQAEGRLESDGVQADGVEHEDGNHEDDASTVDDVLKNDIDSGYLILVNKEHGLDRDYKPDDLADVKYYASDRSAEGRYMRAEAADAFHSLVEEAGVQGMTLAMTTAYRSYDFQSALYNGYVARDGQAAADRYSAKPGKSEHQTGLAVDVSSPAVNYQLTMSFADAAEGKWLAENAHLFGFIIRFPKDKEEITGYQYEPWHLRYVGLASADYIYKNEITLEEYFQLLEQRPGSPLL